MSKPKQPPEVFYHKAVIKNFIIFTGKHLRWSSFLFDKQKINLSWPDGPFFRKKVNDLLSYYFQEKAPKCINMPLHYQIFDLSPLKNVMTN